MARKDDSKKIEGPLIHIVLKDWLKPGDHIYAYRLGGVYAHHGIYIGEPGMEVIHFSGNKLSGKPCVQSCTYKEFKDGALLAHLVAYDVNPITAIWKRAQTVHQYKSRPAKDVVETAKYFLQHPEEYDDYNLYFNNCESFAIYCKTEMVLPSSQLTPFSSVVDGAIAFADAVCDHKKKKALPSSQFTPFSRAQVLPGNQQSALQSFQGSTFSNCTFSISSSHSNAVLQSLQGCTFSNCTFQISFSDRNTD